MKSKRRLLHVSKEYSAVGILLVFILLFTNLVFSPQNGGMPRVFAQAYAPITITAASLPIAPSQPMPQWLDMLSWTQNNLQSTTVVCAWWDYGYWLSILGNVTTLADNATINSTQIENIGFIYMANETQALKMLARYDAKYILVFTTVGISQASGQQYYTASPLGYGDEGKWSWMARISGQARDRLISQGFMDENSAWTDESAFGSVSSSTNQFQWNDKGQNSTIYKLMSWAKQQWCDNTGGYVVPDTQGVEPTYFKMAHLSGLETSFATVLSQYGGYLPLVALYEIDWAAYNNATATISP